MSAHNDGGPAFPVPLAFRPSDGQPCTTGDFWDGNGMSLRDWFAGQALSSMAIPDDGKYTGYDRENGHPKRDALKRADIAYRHADAMLAARAKGGAA